jgi:DNA-binding SARP family transcriptional activator
MTQEEWRSRGKALVLLKVLLCQKNRRASRDILIDALWTEDEQRQMKDVRGALKSTAVVLREVLRIAGEESLLITLTASDELMLAEQQRIWVDADAFEQLVSLAMRATDEQEALQQWELAHALVQGEFLAEDRYSDWAKTRRETLQGKAGECVYALADLYAKQQRPDRAREVLWDQLEAYPTDQDALFRLMTLLEQQQRYHAAWQLYKRARAAITKDDLSLTPRTHALAKRIREKLMAQELPLPVETDSSHRQAPIHSTFPDVQPSERIPIPLLSTPTTPKLPTSALMEKQAADLASLIDRGEDNVVSFDPSRRAAILQLLGITGMIALSPLNSEPWERLSLATTKPTTMNTATFNHFQKLLEICWELSNNGELHIAEHVLHAFLPQMRQLASYRPEAAALVSHGLRLLSILNAHQLNIPAMIPLCRQSVEHAKQANDPNTLSAALTGLAVAFKYAHQAEDSFKTYQEALWYCDKASPLVQSRVYAGAGAAFGHKGRKQEAEFYIRFAYDHFPDHPENDPNFLIADSDIFMLAYYEGIMYLSWNQPKEAEKAFESFKGYFSGRKIPERNRLEIINHQGRAALLSNDLEKYVTCLEDGIVGAIELNSKKRLDEAVNIFQQEMPQKWLTESIIKQIIERFQLQKVI